MDNRHDASGQMSGYFYQTLMALLLLLSTENVDAQILIEKFDDIAFIGDDTPLDLIQVKHQLYKQGNLGDTSVDLWRTINSWVDVVVSNSISIENTKFIIITTAQAGGDSITQLLGRSNRNQEQALKRMQDIAKSNAQATNSAYYKNFLTLSNESMKQLIDNMFIISSATPIIGIEEEIMPYIRMATIPLHEKSVYHKILGWWITQVIDGLQSKTPKAITYSHLRHIINDVGNEYKADSLPIDVDFLYQPSEEELVAFSGEEKIFIRQLMLISLKDNTIKRCIKDYYNAYKQKSEWVREQVLYTEELTKYENRLKDEWERRFQNMNEDLEDYGADIIEDKKIEFGKKLFREIEEIDIRLKNVEDPFIMRGTYHEMANELKVGWHVDFYHKLYSLLKGGSNGKME